MHVGKIKMTLGAKKIIAGILGILLQLVLVVTAAIIGVKLFIREDDCLQALIGVPLYAALIYLFIGTLPLAIFYYLLRKTQSKNLKLDEGIIRVIYKSQLYAFFVIMSLLILNPYTLMAIISLIH
jgi:hypothetical protein